MKYIRVASDMHLEGFFGMPADELEARFLPKDDRDSESIMVLAGDISSKAFQLNEFVRHIQPRFKHVVYVPGNHEYYGSTRKEWETSARLRFVDTGIVTPYNDVSCVELDGVRFVLGTLWGECSHDPETQYVTARGIADFHVIYEKDGNNVNRIAVPSMMQWAAQHRREFLSHLMRDFDGPTVAVSHHLPSFELVSDRFRVSAINGAFVNAVADDIDAEFAPNLWIHGHTHDTIDKHIPVKNGSMRVICNPVGYRNEWNTKYNDYQPTFINVSDL